MSPRAGRRSRTGRRGRVRRVSTGALVAIAVAIAAVCMISLTAKAVISRASCSDRPIVVDVAASYDIAPAIQAAANAFDNQNHSADGRCVQVEVTEGDSSAEAGQIDGQAPVKGRPAIDAWIPDSSLWVDVARSFPLGAQNVQPLRSVARSPLMLVTTPAVAAQTHVFDSQPSWNLLLPPADGGPPASLDLAVDLPDPTDSSTGLGALIEVSREIGIGSTARTAFTQFAFDVEATEDFNSAQGLETFVQSTEPPFDRRAVTVASEQAVLAYDKAYPGTPVAARYPTGSSAALGTPELDYPYVLTTSAAAPLAAATEFGDYLTSSYAQSEIRYYGFRSASGAPDAMPASDGLSSQPLQLATVAGPAEAASSLQAWQKLGLGSRDLDLVDVSSAMNQSDGNGTQSLEYELTQTAARGLSLFPESTRMGLWEMGKSRSASSPYTQLVSLGPLPADLGLITRREQLQQIIQTMNTSKGGKLALHDAILAAYQEMTSTYEPNYANAVLVLTSGVDNAPGDMSLSSLLTKLHALYNPNRKVEIVVLMFGRQGNYSALQQIAAAAGGVAYQISNPAEVGKIFIEAISQRMCTQGCTSP